MWRNFVIRREGKTYRLDSMGCIYDDDTSALYTLSRRMPTTENVMNVLPIIERLIMVIMYNRGSSESSVNGEKLVLFTQKSKEIENIPPTQDALPNICWE